MKVIPDRALWAGLRSAGFRRVERSNCGGAWLTVYEKQVDERRKLTVQIWHPPNPCYRVSSEFLGCSDTAPTEFTTFAEMVEAIQHESTRIDGKYAQPGSCATERAA